MKRKKTFYILRYIFAVVLIIGGLGNLSASVPFGLCVTLAGVSLFPFIWNLIRKKAAIARWVPLLVPLLFFIAATPFTPESAAQSRTIAITDEASGTPEAVVTDTPEITPAEVPTDTPTPETTPEETATPTPTETPTPEPTKEAGEMKVHFLDVGQGLSILVQSDGQTMIYDGGDKSTSSFVVSYLQKQNVTTIDYLISSHYDSDHMAGLIGCLNAFDVKNVISSNYEHDSKLYQSFIQTVADKGLPMQHPAVGTEFSFGSGSFQILAPATIDPNDSNKNSVAIKLTNGDNSFIFTGDAESTSEKAMCESGIDLSCDVLVPGHHGSATATSWDFLQATVPEYAVISCGKDNQYGHPDKDVMDKLESMDIHVYRTDKQGTIVAVSDGTTITWNQEPCNDYSPGDKEDKGTQAQTSQSKGSSSSGSKATANENSSSGNKEVSAASAGASSQVEATPQVTAAPQDTSSTSNEEMVWITATGSKYHNKNNCGTTDPSKASEISRAEAESRGYEPCKKCFR
jgi:competence protein ComEC